MTTMSGSVAKPGRAMAASCVLEGSEYVVADGDVLHFRFNT